MLLAEMEWIPNFFRHRARQWLEWKLWAEIAGKPGHQAYAMRQHQLWAKMAEAATDAFSALRQRHPPPQGDQYTIVDSDSSEEELSDGDTSNTDASSDMSAQE